MYLGLAHWYLDTAGLRASTGFGGFGRTAFTQAAQPVIGTQTACRC